MTMAPGTRPPLDLDQWVASVAPAVQPVALVVAGVDETELDAALTGPAVTGALVWDADRLTDVDAAAAVARARRAGLLGADGAPDVARRHHLRLVVEEQEGVDEIVRRLLACDAVAATVVAGRSTVRSLGPARLVAVTPSELVDELAPGLPAAVELVALSGAEIHADVLLAGPTVGDVRDVLSGRDPGSVVADLVVMPRTSGRPWPDEGPDAAAVAELADAVVVALVDDRLDGAGLAAALAAIATGRAEGVALDVAVTAAFDRDVVLVGDVEALVRSGFRLLSAPPPAATPPPPPPPAAAPPRGRGRPTRSGRRPEPEATGAELEAAGAEPEAAGAEPPTAAAAPPRAAAASPGAPGEPERDDEESLRYLQGYVNRQGDNVLQVGPNQVEVFVGPEEEGGFIGHGMTNEQLGFGPTTRSVRVHAVLVPLDPSGRVQTREIDIPRRGRSTTATFGWSIPNGTDHARARLSLLHRNRVLQTGVLAGDVGGAPVRLTEVVVLWDDFGHVDQRSDFDLALVLNHDERGRAGVVAHRAGATQQILATPELEVIAGRLRDHLLAAAFLPGEQRKRAEAVRKILVATAVAGVSLRHQLEPAIEQLRTLRKIQITTARASWFLPLELIYERQPPDPDAELCARWQAGDECGDDCFPGGDEFAVVCPSAFWGMTRVIERHWVHQVDATAATFLVGKSPTAGREFLRTEGALLAASSKVLAADVTAAATALGDAVVVAKGWPAWQAAIADPAVPADVLVVMPHTDLAADTMEISGTTLEGGRFVGVRHVTGPRDNQPVVILFGCDTAGNMDDPAGWASRFMQQHAGVVFATLTMVLNSHASALAQRLATRLRRPGPKNVSVGELVRDFRVAAVRDDLLAALAITAYGDVDWKVRGVAD